VAELMTEDELALYDQDPQKDSRRMTRITLDARKITSVTTTNMFSTNPAIRTATAHSDTSPDEKRQRRIGNSGDGDSHVAHVDK